VFVHVILPLVSTAAEDVAPFSSFSSRIFLLQAVQAFENKSVNLQSIRDRAKIA
jgi:hypothetical protein